MIRKNQEFLNRVNVILDMLLVIFSYIFASWFWLDLLNRDSFNMAGISTKTIMLAIAYSVMLFLLLSFIFPSLWHYSFKQRFYRGTIEVV